MARLKGHRSGTGMKVSFCAVLVSFILSAIPVKATIIADGGFETPALATNSAQYTPAGSIWEITGSAGVINPPATSQGWFGPSAAEGSQYGFIQHYLGNVGIVSQSVVLNDLGSYELTFQVASRQYPFFSYWQESTYAILWNGNTLMTGTTDAQNFETVTVDFSASAGTHTISFVSQSPRIAGRLDDETTFIDAVSINPNGITQTPEPATMLLLGLGLIGLAGVRKKFQK